MNTGPGNDWLDNKLQDYVVVRECHQVLMSLDEIDDLNWLVLSQICYLGNLLFAHVYHSSDVSQLYSRLQRKRSAVEFCISYIDIWDKSAPGLFTAENCIRETSIFI